MLGSEQKSVVTQSRIRNCQIMMQHSKTLSRHKRKQKTQKLCLCRDTKQRSRKKLNHDNEFYCRDKLFKYSSCKESKNCRDTRHFGCDINQTTSKKLCRDIAKLCRDIIQEESIKICRDRNCMPRQDVGRQR